MKKNTLFVISLFSQLICANVFASIGLGWEPVTSQSAIDALGVEVGNPITNGFIFIDGCYIPPPYVVKREGNGVFINNRLIEERIQWPLETQGEPVIVSELPSMPSTITTQSTLFDKDVSHYLGMAKAYYRQKYGTENIATWMKPIYEALPCVEKVLPADSQSLHVIWKDGTNASGRGKVWLVPPERGIEKWTPETIISEENSIKTLYEEGLNGNEYYFIKTPSSSSSRMTGTQEGAVEVLIPLISILERSQTAKEVYTRFHALEIVQFSENSAKAFFENRDSITPELKERLEALRAKLESKEEF